MVRVGENKTKRALRIIILFIAALLIVGTMSPLSSVAEGLVTLTGNTVKNCKAGDKVAVSFSIPAESYICTFDAKITYDTSYLKAVQIMNSDEELVWVESDVFRTGVLSNCTDGEILVAGAKGGKGYKAAGELLTVSFEVIKELPTAGLQVQVLFSVFQISGDGKETIDKSVQVIPAKLVPPSETSGSTTTTAAAPTGNGTRSSAPPTKLPAPVTEKTTKPTVTAADTTATQTAPTATVVTGTSQETAATTTAAAPSNNDAADKNNKNVPVGAFIIIGCLLVAVAGCILLVIRRKDKENE